MWISPATLLKTNGQLTPIYIIISTCTIIYIWWGCCKIFGEFGVSKEFETGLEFDHQSGGFRTQNQEWKYTQSYIHQLGMDYTTHKSGNFGDGLFFGLSGLPHYCICIFLLFPMWNERTCQVGNTQSVWLSKSGSYNAALVHQVLTNWKVRVRQQFWILVAGNLRLNQPKVAWYTSNFGKSVASGRPPHSYSYGHLPVITGYFYGIIHSINGVLLVLITDKWP